MSFYPSHVPNQQALRRQRMALTARLRQNMTSKVISLIAAVMLYAFVQAEHNPTQTRLLTAAVTLENVPDNVEAETSVSQVGVSVTGPRAILDRIKENRVIARLDMSNHPVDSKPFVAAFTFEVAGMSPDLQRQLAFDTATPTARAQLFSQQSHACGVKVILPRETPTGFHFGTPTVQPVEVKVTGRSDKIARLDHVQVKVTMPKPGDRMEGSYRLQALDDNNHVLDGLAFEPESVHVQVPMIEDPLPHIVAIVPTITDVPLPPYTLTAITITPSQVKIKAGSGAAATMTLATENLSLRDVTRTQEFTVNLVAPPDLDVRDLNNHPVKQVKVKVFVQRRDSSTPPQHDPTVTPPQRDPLTPPQTNDPKPPAASPGTGGPSH